MIFTFWLLQPYNIGISKKTENKGGKTKTYYYNILYISKWKLTQYLHPFNWFFIYSIPVLLRGNSYSSNTVQDKTIKILYIKYTKLRYIYITIIDLTYKITVKQSMIKLLYFQGSDVYLHR